MSWKFPTGFLGGNQVQQQQHQQIPTDMWYSTSVAGSSPNSSRPVTPSRGSDQPQPSSRTMPSQTEAAGIIGRLKDKSVDELRKLLRDEVEYRTFFESLDQVKIQNNLRDELQKETLQLARENLEREPRIMELRNQCTIIRTTELAAAQEKLLELEKQKEEILKFYSPASILQKLQDAITRAEEESKTVEGQFLAGEIDLATFIQRYKKIRQVYHRRQSIHLAARTSMGRT